MRATFSQDRLPGARPGIRGTFYPGTGSGGSGSGSIVPKILAVAVAMVVVRTVIGAKRTHGGSSRWSRRREAIAEFHRELHAEDAATASAEPTGRAGGRTSQA